MCLKIFHKHNKLPSESEMLLYVRRKKGVEKFSQIFSSSLLTLLSEWKFVVDDEWRREEEVSWSENHCTNQQQRASKKKFWWKVLILTMSSSTACPMQNDLQIVMIRYTCWLWHSTSPTFSSLVFSLSNPFILFIVCRKKRAPEKMLAEPSPSVVSAAEWLRVKWKIAKKMPWLFIFFVRIALSSPSLSLLPKPSNIHITTDDVELLWKKMLWEMKKRSGK